METAIVFVLGVAAGIAWYKFYILHTIERITHTACDYCQFQICKEEIKKEFFPRKKNRSEIQELINVNGVTNAVDELLEELRQEEEICESCPDKSAFASRCEHCGTNRCIQDLERMIHSMTETE